MGTKVIPREVRRITYSTKIRNLKQRNFSPFQKAVIVGSILGDGNVEWNWSKTNFRLKIEQSEKYKNYVFWKYRVLKKWVLTKPKYHPTNKSFSFKTISHPEITKLAKDFYHNGRKIIPPFIAKFIKNPIVLAVWFMDDGNIIKRNRKVYGYHLNTQSFTRNENKRLIKALKEAHGLESLLENNHGYYRIRIMQKDSREKLRRIIKDHILYDMRYKIG